MHATDTSLFAFVLTCIAIEFTPGANLAYLVCITSGYGKRAGLVAVTGIALGLWVLGVGVAWGLKLALAITPQAIDVVRYAGAAYLLWLAYQSWHARLGKARDNTSHTYRSFFLCGVTLNLLNPKAAMFYLAVFSSFGSIGGHLHLGYMLLLNTISVAIATLAHAGIVLASSTFSHFIADEKILGFSVPRLCTFALVGVAVWVIS